MPSMSAIASIAAFVTQPSCSCARMRSGITADCWRPSGYFRIVASAQTAFSSLKANAAGCTLSSASRRTDILLTPYQSWNRAAPQQRLSLRLRGPSAIDLAEHDVERAEDRGHVGKLVAAAQEIHRLKMREPGRPQLAAVWSVAAIGDEVDAERALRRLDGRIHFTGVHVIAFRVELEMMDQRFHPALHLASLRRHDLAVERRDRTDLRVAEQPADALLHDLHRFAHLEHAD